MYAVHKEIIIENSDYTVTFRDIKYKSERKRSGKIIYANNDYIVFGHWAKWYISGKSEYTVNAGRDCIIAGDNLFVRYYNHSNNDGLYEYMYDHSRIYSLANSSEESYIMKCFCGYDNVLLLPNGKLLASTKACGYEFLSWNDFTINQPPMAHLSAYTFRAVMFNNNKIISLCFAHLFKL